MPDDRPVLAAREAPADFLAPVDFDVPEARDPGGGTDFDGRPDRGARAGVASFWVMWGAPLCAARRLPFPPMIDHPRGTL